MTSPTFMILLSCFIVLASAGKAMKKATGLEKEVNEMKEILDDLKGKVAASSDLETRLAAAEGQLKEAQGKLEAAEGKLEAAEGEIQALKDNPATSELETRVEAAESEIQTLKDNPVTSELETRVEAAEGKLEAAEGEIQTLKDNPATSNNELMIISAADGVRDASCVRSCSGVAGADGWGVYTHYAGKKIDITSCGFVTRPVVTTGFHAVAYMDGRHGTITFDDLNKNWFRIYIVDPQISSNSNVGKYGTRVQWTAVGYTC